MKKIRNALLCFVLTMISSMSAEALVASGCPKIASSGISTKGGIIIKKCSFGDTKIIDGGGLFMSTDWVIVTRYSNNTSLAKCLNGAPNHTAMWANINGFKPVDWIYTQGSGSFSRYIMYVGGDTYYSSPIQVMKSSPIPSGWVTLRIVSGDYKVIQSTKNAPVGTQIWVISSSSVPSDWSVVNNSTGYKLIQKKPSKPIDYCNIMN